MPESTASDEDLLQMVRSGEPEGATVLFQRYSAPLLRFTTRMLGNRAEAEETTQDVFLKIISKAGQFDGRASFSSWIYAIAANACRDQLRRGGRSASVPLEAIAEAQDPGEGAETRLLRRQRRNAVRNALSRLSNEQREVLLLARYEGMRYSEIARTLEITEGAVKTRMFRAMETLKEFFSEGDSRYAVS